MSRILINSVLIILVATMAVANPSNNKPASSTNLGAVPLASSTSTVLNKPPSSSSSSSPSSSPSSPSSSSSSPQQPTLLTLEQQQELLEQLAQLQRQTQQLLAAQQSLAAVAAAAAVNGGNNGGVNIPASSGSASSNTHLHQHFRQPQQPSTSVVSSQHQHHVLSRANIQQSQVKPMIQSQTIQQQPPSQTTQTQDTLSNGQSGAGSMTGLPQSPQINWGKCPELEPSEQEKLAKANVITKCLETTPLPANITRESVEQHREQIAACALRSEGWFTPDGGYDFGKAEKEIKNKRLQEDLEHQVLNYHSQCKIESEEKYPSTNSSIIAQIQLYQACMDYFISDVCGIEVNDADTPQF